MRSSSSSTGAPPPSDSMSSKSSRCFFARAKVRSRSRSVGSSAFSVATRRVLTLGSGDSAPVSAAGSAVRSTTPSGET